MSIEISVVIPTYQRPSLLIKCLQQLAEQNFQKEKYEVIVVSDGPDNDTKSAVYCLSQQEFYFNLYCYSLPEKKGPAAARNIGAAYAKGELLVFTDDDCLPGKEWLSSYYKTYKEIAEVQAAFTGKTLVPLSVTPTDYEKNIFNLQTAEFITANCAVTKTAFKKINGFDEDFSIAWREDSDIHFKLIKASIKIYKVKNATVIHPVRKTRWGISLKEQKKNIFNALLFKKHSLLYKQRIQALPQWNYYAMIFSSLTAIASSFYHFQTAALISFAVWLILVAEFFLRRLKSTSKSLSHIAEMMVTSAIIPFLSVFWTLYGSFKYKTFLL